MERLWLERVVAGVCLLVGLAGLGASVAVALRERSWGLPGQAVAGTVAGGVAWCVLFLGVGLALDLLVQIAKRMK